MDVDLYASRLARLPVLDPDGLPVGRVADIVVGPPSAGRPPPVLGFVVVVPGRRIFVGVGRVDSLAAEGLRLTSGTVNLRGFAARSLETLIIRDLLGRRLPGTDEVVNDVGLGAAGRGWEIVAVHVAPADRRSRLPRRHGSNRPWTAMASMLGSEQDTYAHLRELHPVEAAAQVRALSPLERGRAARSLDDEQLADLLEELPEDVQAELLGVIDVDRAADVLEVMQPDDAVDLLGFLRGERRTTLLAAMDPAEAEPLRRLLRYEGDTAGGLMTPEPIILAPSATVAEAIARIRDPEVPAAIAAQVFVVEPPTETPTGPFLGVCSIQRLLRERPGIAVKECLERGNQPVPATLGEVEIAERLAAYNLLALPVCDEHRRLLGAVTVDDVLDRVLPQGWRER
ncbi:MAG: magnesium transporter MgtE N-terminal domain-containing protein [Egibacteraceae bacterium]